MSKRMQIVVWLAMCGALAGEIWVGATWKRVADDATAAATRCSLSLARLMPSCGECAANLRTCADRVSSCADAIDRANAAERKPTP